MKYSFVFFIFTFFLNCSNKPIVLNDISYIHSNDKDFNELLKYKFNYIKGRDTLINLKLYNKIMLERKNIIKFVNNLKIKEDYILISESYFYNKDTKDFFLSEIGIIFPSTGNFSICKDYIKKNNQFIFKDNSTLIGEDIDLLLDPNYKLYNNTYYNNYNSVYIENLIYDNNIINLEFNLFFTEKN